MVIFLREAQKFINKQRELNIERSTSVSLYKKQRKLSDGTVVWDSVVKPRKKTTAECSKSPKYHLGLRNGWIKEFSNMLSSKASNYVLETMSAERTSRQQEIAQTLLNRFNSFLEQEASLQDPKTQTEKVMVMMADKLSIWLDKNVKVSKSVGVRLRQLEEEKGRKKLKEEKMRREQEKRDRDEEKKKLVEAKPASEIMQHPSQTGTKPKEPDSENEVEATPASEIIQHPSQTGNKPKEPESENEVEPKDQTTENEDAQETKRETSDTDQKDERKPGDGGQGGEQPLDQGSESIPPSNDIPEVKEPSKDDDKLEDNQQITQEGQVEPNIQGNSRDLEESSKGLGERTSSQKIEEENLIWKASPESVEPDLTQNLQLRKILDIQPDDGGESNTGGESNADGDQLEKVQSEGTFSTHPAPDVLLEDSDTPYESKAAFGESSPPSSVSEYIDGDKLSGSEPSKDSKTLVAELLGSTKESEDREHVDDHGDEVEDRTNRVLEQVAEIIAATREEYTPLQEAIKDIMEKELEERLGDKNVEAINEVAGKVATWMDKMVERAAEEYGERRPSRVRSASPQAASVPKKLGGPPTPGTIPIASHSPDEPARHSPTVIPRIPKPEGLESTMEPVPQAPVTQKPKGPIFELRKVDTNNIFNVVGPISNTKARRKIRRARGQSSNRVSEESLNVGEWAEWAGLVSDVGQNWAKWIEGVAQGAIVKRPDHNNDKRLSHDAKEWKAMNKALQREGEVWMEKVIRKGKKTSDKSSRAKAISAGI